MNFIKPELFRRDPEIVADLREKINKLAQSGPLKDRKTPVTIMEVCGTHTMSIYRYGLKDLLPPNVRLISGPGCPVCVTTQSKLEQAISIASLPEVIFCTFGDMLRVPSARGSLQDAISEGAHVKMVNSPLEALDIAIINPDKQIVFFAIGFETTIPTTAATIELAREKGVKNFSILCAHKTMPQALRALLAGAVHVDALLCPGHVCAVAGAKLFDFVAEELHKPAVVAGFEPADIMSAIAMLLKQVVKGESKLEIAYGRSVHWEGNAYALAVTERVFEASDADWRGLGMILGSGLQLREIYQDMDAEKRFAIYDTHQSEDSACRCGEVLRGEISPDACPLMGDVCSPLSPVGACMVSAEGSCAAYYKYGRK